jgi:PERQ amino acid-rich with GYF domain-containing protein
MKKEEVRKAAERKQRTSSRPTNPTQTTEEVLVGAWGLPTSQAGSRINKEKDVPVLAASPISGPVWTNVVRPSTGKKSMKEILEEEKRQQAQVRDKETAAINAKRAYAESATKVRAFVIVI